MRRAALALLAIAALTSAGGALAPPSPAATPQTTVETIEHEVMCPICGTLLELAESPQAQRERIYVARLVAAGRSRSEVKDALVAQYGPEVLALPKASGFDLSAYLVPIVAIVLAAAAAGVGVARWRRGGTRPGAAATTPAPGDEDAERLEADLSRYDL
jgi:cytochrome c-type biogenesis protein CcmH/NrfF